ncbi:MAG: hypothetical protein EAZ43_02390 [Betaproteobacteria bacterium]|nr:MAG: hypothetical protein EAZ43_02390 [Betaproteobacteria bacterium]
MANTLDEVVEEYLALQRELMAIVAATYPNELRSELLLDMPKNGRVFIREDCWLYRRHGTGLKFTRERDGAVVDVAVNVLSAQVFDAHRLSQYLESAFNVEVFERALTLQLEEMVALGYLTHSKRALHGFELSDGRIDDEGKSS